MKHLLLTKIAAMLLPGVAAKRLPVTIHKVGEEVQISLREGDTGIKMAVSNSPLMLRPALQGGIHH